MKTRLRVGVIGCGLMGGIHAECFTRDKNCELVGLYNPTAAKAEALAMRFGGEVYNSVTELLEYSGCDAVSITSPQQAHAAQVIAAANSGKHILCEKPLGLTMQELDNMEKAVAQSGKVFMVAHQMRFHPVTKWVKKSMSRLGQVFHLQLEWPLRISGHEGRAWADYRSGGFFMELGCHAADLARHLLGEVQHVSAFTLRLNPRRVTEDFTQCLLQFESGAIASLTVSANHRVTRQGLLRGRVLGEKGRIEFSIYPYQRSFNHAKLILDVGKSVFVPDEKVQKMPTNFPASLDNSYRGFFDVYQQEITAFVNSIRQGSTPPVTFQDGRAAVEIVLAAYDSQGKFSQQSKFGRSQDYRSDASCHPLLAAK